MTTNGSWSRASSTTSSPGDGRRVGHPPLEHAVALRPHGSNREPIQHNCSPTFPSRGAGGALRRSDARAGWRLRRLSLPRVTSWSAPASRCRFRRVSISRTCGSSARVAQNPADRHWPRNGPGGHAPDLLTSSQPHELSPSRPPSPQALARVAAPGARPAPQRLVLRQARVGGVEASL